MILLIVGLYACGWCVYHASEIAPHISGILEFIYG